MQILTDTSSTSVSSSHHLYLLIFWVFFFLQSLTAKSQVFRLESHPSTLDTSLRYLLPQWNFRCLSPGRAERSNLIASALLHGQQTERGTCEDLQKMTASFEVLPSFHQQVSDLTAPVGKANLRLEHRYPLGKSRETPVTPHPHKFQPICPSCRTGTDEAVSDHGASTHILHKDAESRKKGSGWCF